MKIQNNLKVGELYKINGSDDFVYYLTRSRILGCKENDIFIYLGEKYTKSKIFLNKKLFKEPEDLYCVFFSVTHNKQILIGKHIIIPNDMFIEI